MKRLGLLAVQYALLMYDANDQKVTGTSSPSNLARARLLARSTLFLMPQLAYIHIHGYDASGVMAPQPLERVDWDQEWVEA